MIQQDINCNLPFVAKSFNEHNEYDYSLVEYKGNKEKLDKSLSSAKIEIDAFIDSKIRQTGIQALKDQVANTNLIDSKET